MVLIDLWTPKFIMHEKKRLVDKLIVAKWQALATYKGFVNNYISC